MGSYLTDRIYKKGNVNETNCSGASLIMGVPRGSILGPLFFLIYIGDLPHLTGDLCEIMLLADGTSLILKIDRRATGLDGVSGSIPEGYWITQQITYF